MNFRLSVINSIRSLEKSIFGQICLFLIKISPMASKKRKLEIDEDDLIAGRIDGIEWKPLQKDSVNKIRADYVNPCFFWRLMKMEHQSFTSNVQLLGAEEMAKNRLNFILTPHYPQNKHFIRFYQI